MQEELNALADKLLAAKKTEAAAKARRIEIEEEIIELTGKTLDKQKTTKTDEYAITVGWKMNYRTDWELFDNLQVADSIAPVKLKRELDVKKYNELLDNQPEIFRAVSKCVIATPGKPSVSIKRRNG